MRGLGFLLLVASLAGSLAAQHDVLDLTQHKAAAAAGVQDIDKDGFDDVVLGNPDATHNRVRVGGAKVVSGRDGRVLFEFFGEGYRDNFGSAVTGPGDLNGDGWPDVVIAAEHAPYGGSNREGPGVVYTYSGRDGKLLRRRVGQGGILGQFGRALAGPGDLDGDGRNDLLVSEMAGNGAVYAYSGRTGGLVYKVPAPAPRTGYGGSLASLGDIDNDKRPDFLVGAAAWEDVSRRRVGAVVVHSGRAGKLIRVTPGPSRNTAIGSVCSGLGDVSGDKVPDYIAGAPGSNFGSALVFNGATGQLLRQLDGAARTAKYGKGVTGVADFDKDGFAEIVIATEWHSPTVVYSGFDIVSGKTFQRIGFIYGDYSSQYFGDVLEAVGDVNGDDLPDFIGNTVGYRRPRVYSATPLGLTTRTHTSSILFRSPQVLDVHATSANAKRFILVLGSASGIKPGIKLGNSTLPLNLDAYFGLTLAVPNAVIYNNLTQLDGAGTGKVAFVPPAGLPASLGGLVLHHAYFVIEPTLSFASNAVAVRLTKF